jgi:hypothetical protein
VAIFSALNRDLNVYLNYDVNVFWTLMLKNFAMFVFRCADVSVATPWPLCAGGYLFEKSEDRKQEMKRRTSVHAVGNKPAPGH